jgi:porphobilinogen deaminase
MIVRSLTDIPLRCGKQRPFTKEIEEAMLAGRIDIAVHSTKDMPVAQPDGLVLDFCRVKMRAMPLFR